MRVVRKCGYSVGSSDTILPTARWNFPRFNSVWIMLVLSAAALVTMGSVSAEINEEYGVFKIQQKTACPTIFCPWNCERYIDNSGCLYCGKCLPQAACPPVTCPSLPFFQCVSRQGRDGCTVCKCRVRPRQPYGGATTTTTTSPPSEMSALKLPPAPRPPMPPAVAHQAEVAVVPQQQLPEMAIGGGLEKRKPGCGAQPMCSQNCRIENDVNGCPRCKCTPRRDCPEAANAPCRRGDCRRELGADGCYHCQCPDDVAVCREVKCFKPCSPLIDWTTGCATGCRCPNDAKN